MTNISYAPTPQTKKNYLCGNKAQLKLFDFKFALPYYQEGVGVVRTLLHPSLCWNNQDKESMKDTKII